MNGTVKQESVIQYLCPGLQVQNTLLGFTFLVGIVSNVWLVILIAKHRKHQWTPDKIFIINLGVVDLLACVSSLPLHLVFLNTRLNRWSSAVCLARFYTMFSFFAVNIMTMAAISVDRNDAICCVPYRKMTSSKAVLTVVFVWFFALCSTAAGGSVFFINHLESKAACTYYGEAISVTGRRARGIMIAIVALWIFPSLAIMTNRFIGIMRFVKEHSQQIQEILGHTRAKREISLTKTCVGFCVTYLMLWSSFAICIIIRNQLNSLEAHCAFLWTYTAAYSSFSAVAVEYIIMDKRFWRRRRRRIQNMELNDNRTSHR